MGLVHLNGRVYDPITGRMVSADPTVPDAGDLQAWNRFSYVNNRPLNFTDPTGFSSELDENSQTVTVTGSKVNGDGVRANGGFAIVGNPIAMSSGGMGAGGAVYRVFRIRVPMPGTALIKQTITVLVSDSLGLAALATSPIWSVMAISANNPNNGSAEADADALSVAPGTDTGGANSAAGGASPPPDDDGPNSKYDRATKGRSVENRSTDVGQSEFKQNLRHNGWKESTSKDGQTTIFEKDGARYVVRDNARSTGGPTADYYQSGSSSINVKIRLGGP